VTKIKITVDSTCDLSRELMEKYDIAAQGLHVNIGDASYTDGVDIRPEEDFRAFEETGQLAQTAAVSIGEYEEFFRRFTRKGFTVIHINISLGFSLCYSNACIAAGEVGGVFCVDSRNLSTGSGLIALLAAELAAGDLLSPEEIVVRLNEAAGRVEASFVIDTLDYLYKGGRCSALAAFGANLLKLKPCIEVREGLMGVGHKYRGRIDKAVEEYVTERLRGRRDIDCKRVFITHTGCAPEVVGRVREIIAALQPFEEVLETTAGCTVSCHCGPGTLGVLFVRTTG